MRQIQGLRAAVVGLAVDAILVVAAGTILDALLGIEQQHRARPENYGARRADARATRLQAFIQTIPAQFALSYAGIESHPLKLRNLIRACDGAVAASNALVGGPFDHAAFRIFVQRLEGTTRRTSRIEALHALPFHEGVRGAVFRLVELDDVAGKIVQVVGCLV